MGRRVGVRLRVAVRAAYDADRPLSERRARRAAEAGHREGMTVYGLGLACDGRFDEAEHWLRLATDAGDPLAPVALGTMSLERGDWERGLAYLRAAQARHGALSARLALIQVWARRTVPFDRGTRPDGVPDPALPPSPTAEARAAVRAGRSAADWADLRRALRPDPATDSPDIIPSLLIMRVAEGDVAAAHAWFTTAAEAVDAQWAPQRDTDLWPVLRDLIGTDQELAPDAAKALGALAGRAGDPEAAESLFAAAARSGDPEAMLFHAEIHADRHGTDRAEHLFRAAADAGHPAAQHTLGVLLMRRGENDAARQYLRRAADAGNTDSLINLGVLLRGAGDLDGAEACYRQAVEAGDLADGHNNLGNLLMQRGDPQGAAESWRIAAAQGSGAAMASCGALHAERGELDRAEDLFRRSAAAGDTTGMLNLAQLLKADGRVREALHWLEAASGPAPTRPAAETRPAPPDLDAIAAWLQGPAQRGDTAAQQALDRIRRDTGP